MLVGYAVRNKVGELVYDDTFKDYLPKFPWHSLKTKLKYKCEGAGIRFKDEGKSDETEDTGGNSPAKPARKGRQSKAPART